MNPILLAGAIMIGAQIFIEPGQSDNDIDRLFSVMEDNGMTVGRVRMFGSHITDGRGNYDFSLYDKAFDAADRHGIKLFVTLFPPTDELTDVGGFKFPDSKAHLDEIDEYVTRVVTHFKDSPALLEWVLQNEPGLEDATSVVPNDLSDSIRAKWAQAATEPIVFPRQEFLKADFSNENFLRYYTTWYLRHIADLVKSIDPSHGRHINPHQLMKNLPQYDFTAYEDFLTSLGVSLHLSWHFGLYSQEEYPAGVSLMCDIIRSGAGRNPFWVTELQGGNVTASGRVPYCPTGSHVEQYLWDAVGAGAKGVVFWSLNPRRAVQEAGEWGMIDFQGEPSDRLLAAGEVARVLKAEAPTLVSMQPAECGIAILYNPQSFLFQKRNSDLYPSPEAGRRETAVAEAMIGAYEAVIANGVVPEVCDMEAFDWSNPRNRVVILPDVQCLPDEYVAKIEKFVKAGGKLIVTGRSFFFDGDMRCTHAGTFPLEECFGARLAEYKVHGDYFRIAPDSDLSSHLWRGFLKPVTAEPVIKGADGSVLATRNLYGKGEVLWIPSMIELGARHDGILPLARLVRKECKKAIEASPVYLDEPVANILVRTMTAPGKKEAITVIVNKNKEASTLTFKSGEGLEISRAIYSDAAASGRTVTIAPDSTSVLLWK